MHVSYGLRPNAVDDDVRFRTTYYFRTFDYCWDANLTAVQIAGSGPLDKSYRKIIPETDTLYRYRMTGKASALFSKVRFESGVLGKEEIDPFGTEVAFSEAANGFYVRDRAEVKAAAESGTRVNLQRARIDDMVQRFSTMPETTDIEKNTKRAVADQITAAVKLYLEGAVLTSAEATTLKGNLDKVEQATVGNKEEIAALRKLIEAKSGAADAPGPCAIGQAFRKGFQIMGPEGIKTFDQNERLVMAMSSSAKPLIETLQEYSGRILNNRLDFSTQFLVLARENARIEAIRRKVADGRRLKQGAAALMDAALHDAGATE
jgi:hypothetical protein